MYDRCAVLSVVWNTHWQNMWPQYYPARTDLMVMLNLAHLLQKLYSSLQGVLCL